MSDVVTDDDLNALAAEYVLGTLDYEERKGATALLEVDHAFRGTVRIWERRFGELHLMVEAVEPDPQLWARIRPKTAEVEQLPLAIPPSHAERPAEAAAAAAPGVVTPVVVGEPVADAAAAAPATNLLVGDVPAADVPAAPPVSPAGVEGVAAATPPDAPGTVPDPNLKLAELAALLPVAAAAQQETVAVPEPAPTPRAPDQIPRGFVPPPPMIKRSAPAADMVRVRRTGKGWIAATLLMTLAAAALGGLIGAWRYFPERLPDPLRATAVLNLGVPAAPAPAPRPQLPPFDE